MRSREYKALVVELRRMLDATCDAFDVSEQQAQAMLDSFDDESTPTQQGERARHIYNLLSMAGDALTVARDLAEGTNV